MAQSMIKRRQEAERERLEAYQATLRRIQRAERPAPDFDKALKEAKKGFEGETVRDCASWRPRLKTRDANRLRLAAARHLFARYPAPAHLEAVWLEGEGLDAEEAKLRKRWFITVAGGGSLYKAQDWLSRKEAHWFLNPPGELGFAQAFWVAIARTYTDDLGVALRIGRSKVSRTARGDLAFVPHYEPPKRHGSLEHGALALAAACITLVLSALSWHGLERPAIEWARRRLRR